MFGVLLMDIHVLYRPEAAWTDGEQSVARFLLIFGDSKFWTLLAFLFGLGFSLQLAREPRHPPGFIANHRLRLFGLLLIGVSQQLFLLWGGSILINYAVMGFLLLGLRRLPARILLFAGVILLLMPWAYSMGVDFIHARRLADPQTRVEISRGDAELKAAATALKNERQKTRFLNYPRRVALQARLFYLRHFRTPRQALSGQFFHPGLVYVSWLGSLGLFLFGVYIGRRSVLHNIATHLPAIRRVCLWGLAIGLAVSAVRYVTPEPSIRPYPMRDHLVLLLVDIGDTALAFAYGAALVLLAQRGLWKKLLARLAAAGRMALTNYLLMAVLLGLLMPAFGFAVYQQVGPTGGVVLAVAIYAGLMVLSRWWLARFRFGPAEWLWRSATYGKWQPMRLVPAKAAGVTA